MEASFSEKSSILTERIYNARVVILKSVSIYRRFSKYILIDAFMYNEKRFYLDLKSFEYNHISVGIYRIHHRRLPGAVVKSLAV